jgi:hypothetical protein
VGDDFTCDLGVVSALLREVYGPEPDEHWSIRLGHIVVGYDKWWDLTVGKDTLAADFLPALSRGLEYLEPLATDEGLRDRWLHDAATQPYGISPIEADWLVALARLLGTPDWARTAVLHVSDGSVVQLQWPTPGD